MTVFGILLRVYLFAGLAAHKILWELLKRGQGQSSAQKISGHTAFLPVVKAGKIAITLGLFAQLFLPEILPIRDNPLGPRVVGAILFTFGLVIAILARLELGNNWSDIETGQVKQNHMLVNQGVYRYIRHPIYTGILLSFLGTILLQGEVRAFLGFVFVLLALYRKAKREEQFLSEEFGEGFADHLKHTGMFLPRFG